MLLETPLYSHSSQRQHLDDDVHQLLSLCYNLGMFCVLGRYTPPSLFTTILIPLRHNQDKDHNVKYFSTIQLIRVFYESS